MTWTSLGCMEKTQEPAWHSRARRIQKRTEGAWLDVVGWHGIGMGVTSMGVVLVPVWLWYGRVVGMGMVLAQAWCWHGHDIGMGVIFAWVWCWHGHVVGMGMVLA